MARRWIEEIAEANVNGRVLMALLACTLWLPAAPGEAQALYRPTPHPEVSAELERWYVDGEPLLHAGNVYYPTGPKVHFNPHEMVQTGTYRGIPLYARTTLETMSVVFVPVGRGLLQPYERRRAGDLAGTVGSQMPSFPVVRTGPEPVGTTGIGGAGSRVVFVEEAPRAAIDTAVPEPKPWVDPREPKEPGPRDGIFITFGGERYYGEGPPVKLDPSRLTEAGQHLGWPIYRRAGDAALYVPVRKDPDAPLARYRRR